MLYLVDEGFAHSGFGTICTFPPAVAYQDEIREAQAFAREREVGLGRPAAATTSRSQ